MKKYVLLMLAIYHVSGVEEVNMFAQGLWRIAQHEEEVKQLYGDLLRAYQNGQFDQVEQMLDAAPRDLFDIHLIDKGEGETPSILLFDFLDGYMPYSTQQQDRKRALAQQKIFNAVIKKSSADQLLLSVEGRNILTRFLENAVPRHVIENALKKSPKLLLPTAVKTGKYMQKYNPLLSMIQSYVSAYTNQHGGQIGASGEKHHADVITSMLQTSSHLSFADDYFLDIFKEFFDSFLTTFITTFMEDQNEKQHEELNQEFLDSSITIVTQLIKRDPRILYWSIPGFLRSFVNSTNDQKRELLKQFIQNNVKLFNQHYDAEKNTILMDDEWDWLVKEDNTFKADKLYSLNQILSAAGLKDLVPK